MSSDHTTDLERWVSPGSSLEIFQKSPPYPPLRGLDSVVTLSRSARKRSLSVCSVSPHCKASPTRSANEYN